MMKDTAGSRSETTIHTVGYEKSTLQDYIDCLLTEGIELLVDVRERPLSRKRGFSKRALSEAVEAVGIDYVHLQALGDPKPGREAARAGRHDEFVRIFSEHMQSREAREAMEELVDNIAGKKICLTCFEKDHSCCHRSIVADQLADKIGAPIVHLCV